MIRNLFFAFLICSFIATPAFSSEDKIAVVDIKKIMDEALSAKDIAKKVEASRVKFQKTVADRENSLRKEEKTLADQQGIMAKEAFNKKASEFQKKVVEAQRDIQNQRSTIEKGYSNAINKIREVTSEIVANISKEKKISIVLAKSQTLFVNDKLDITTSVLKRLDKKLPKVKVVIK